MAVIDAFYKNRFAIPVNDGNITNWYNPQRKVKGKLTPHLGLDFSWWKCNPNSKNSNAFILACQDGIVVEQFYSSSTGNSIVLQHDYSDGTHAWSAYIHLKYLPTFEIGQEIKMNEVIGIKGNTGQSNGAHLHLYLTKTTTKNYSWVTMKANTIDPYPVLYKSRTADYVYLGSYLNVKQYLEDLPQKIEYPKPVERDTSKKQVNVIHNYLRLRNGNGTNYDIYDEFCQKGIYNILEEKLDASKTYNWYKIDVIDGNEFWIASGGTRTEDLLPEKSTEQLLTEENQQLKQQIIALQSNISNLNDVLAKNDNYITQLENRIKDAKNALD